MFKDNSQISTLPWLSSRAWKADLYLYKLGGGVGNLFLCPRTNGQNQVGQLVLPFIHGVCGNISSSQVLKRMLFILWSVLQSSGQAGSSPFCKLGAWDPEVHLLAIFTRSTDNDSVILRLIGTILDTSCRIEVLLEGTLEGSIRKHAGLGLAQKGSVVIHYYCLQDNSVNMILLTQQYPRDTSIDIAGLKTLFRCLGSLFCAGAGLALRGTRESLLSLEGKKTEPGEQGHQEFWSVCVEGLLGQDRTLGMCMGRFAPNAAMSFPRKLCIALSSS